MSVIFKTKITAVGEMVDQLLQEQTLILFDDNAPKELQDISVLHSGRMVNGRVQPGDILKIDNEPYKIIFVGDQANQSIQDLGHVTFKFNGSQKDLPGSICIEEKPIPRISPGMTIEITR